MKFVTYRIGDGREFYSDVAIVEVDGLYYGDNFSLAYGEYVPERNTPKLIEGLLGKLLFSYGLCPESSKGNSDVLKGYLLGKGFYDKENFNETCVFFK